ncbi:PIN domain protein [hydrothermal vent metagenome]|uniref:PIN domain protein n=1 Tax=hydrothermal vent metagenome TaxID=652676 RepID=A0A3B1CBP2_9ZZZZ
MVLVDTSVWIDHLRNNNKELSTLLLRGTVVMHEFVLGELASGNIKNRKEILELLQSILSIPKVTIEEYLFFVKEHRLFGKGIGFVDIHLLASAKLSGILLWTLDKKLREVASTLNLSYK